MAKTSGGSSSKFAKGLPNSSFAWVDGDGNGHLPYKNADGSINVAHTRNALARLSQVKGMPDDVRKRVKAKLEAALAKSHSEQHSFLNRIEFADDTSDAGLPWIDAFKAGEWHDPRYGVTPLGDEQFDNIIKNFNDNVRGIDIAIDYDHGTDKAKGNKAAGWIRALRRVGDKVQAAVEFTEEAAKEVKDKQWRYFSPTWQDDYTHSEGGAKFKDVLTGGALTNKPVFKGVAPINFAEAVLDEEMTLIPEDSVPPPAPALPTPEPHKEDTVDEAQLRQALGIGEKDSIEDAIKSLKNDAKSFAELRDAADKHKSFAEQFPEEFKAQQELRERVIKAEAKEFAENLTQPVDLGDGKKSKVFPPKVTDKVAEVYREFAENHGTLDSLKSVLNTVRETGTVELGERGKSTDSGGETPAGDDAIREFSEKMGDIMRTEKIAPQDAMMKVAREHPDLYKAYIDREIPVR